MFHCGIYDSVQPYAFSLPNMFSPQCSLCLEQACFSSHRAMALAYVLLFEIQQPKNIISGWFDYI